MFEVRRTHTAGSIVLPPLWTATSTRADALSLCFLFVCSVCRALMHAWRQVGHCSSVAYLHPIHSLTSSLCFCTSVFFFSLSIEGDQGARAPVHEDQDRRSRKKKNFYSSNATGASVGDCCSLFCLDADFFFPCFCFFFALFPAGAQVLRVDRRFHLGFSLHFPADVDLEAGQ